ncbi:hypothetical protein OIU76_003418 [Salix suchowensis]|nr:hypothetical protein OIU76_003418 [Salix suchowensis]KAJ6346735.1 hypothetical protein OIU76_003418 [Salix suchowensis]KAJ6346736.1 hypothetical protein OIU76_003418 [Salix suchowensis]
MPPFSTLVASPNDNKFTLSSLSLFPAFSLQLLGFLVLFESLKMKFWILVALMLSSLSDSSNLGYISLDFVLLLD